MIDKIPIRLVQAQYRKHFLVVCCYTMLTIALTYPVTFHLTDHIAGFSGEDNLQWRWFIWWFKHALLTLQTSVTDVSILYAPTGGEQPFYAITTFVPSVALPITLLGGPTTSYNISFLLAFVLSGYTTYLLAYYFTRHHLAAFIAGLVFAFYPARFGYATGTFLGQLTTYFLPLYVLALFMLAQRPGKLRAIWAAIVLAGLCITWSLLVAYGVVIFTTIFFIFQVVTWLRNPRTRISLKYFAVVYALAFILVIPLYSPLLIQVWQGKQSHISGAGTIYMATDLLAFISPSNYHPVLQSLHLIPEYAQSVLADRDDIQERLAYLGITPVILILTGLFKYRKKLLFWLVTALIAMVLSLGPLLKFGGKLFQLNIEGYTGYVVLPYALLQSIPVLNWSMTLGRLNLVTMLCVAVMVAYGATFLLSNFSVIWQRVLTIVLSTLILFEFLTIFPFPVQPDTVPEFYYHLRQEGAENPQSIVDLPLVGEPIFNNYSMHYQTVHEQSMAGGHFIRRPAGADRVIGFVNQLLQPPLTQSVMNLPDTSARLGLLNKFGFTKVIVRQWLMTNEEVESQSGYLSSWLNEPRQEEQISVFEVPSGGQSLEITSLLAGSWQPIEDGSLLQLESPANLMVYVDSEEIQRVALQLSLLSPHPDRYLTIDIDGRPSIRLYVTQEMLSYQIPIWLEPGFHQFTFRPQELCQRDCDPVNFSGIALEKIVPSEMPPPIVFGNRLSLMDSTVSEKTVKPSQPVLIYLYWQSLDKLTEDYTVFVHLISPSGQLISQADYLLGGRLYPTSQWPSDFITAFPTLFFIPPEASSGEYELRVGVYQAATGERILADIDSGSGDSILISTIVINP